MDKLSVVIITFNEERNIARCLESVRLIADEVVVVDSHSTDQTEAICTQYGVRFYKHDFEGHIQQKNHALSLSKYDYVLSLDADEAISGTLEKSILEVKKATAYHGFSMNRLTNYCGSWIHHCGWYPDTKLRLFDKTKGEWTGVNPHDEFKLFDKKMPVKQLKGDLLHYSFYTLDDHLKQVELFTDISSKANFERGKRATWFKLWVNPAAKFFRDYILNKGFLDGKAGLRICWISAAATHKKYVKLKSLYRS